MGVTIQFESHHHELAGIYSMEYDTEVLEYYGSIQFWKIYNLWDNEILR
jgi:hypothetical protein